MQGATTIASWTETALTDTWVERNRALTAPQLAAITDNTALSLRVTATQD
jgi:hypothetical protein